MYDYFSTKHQPGLFRSSAWLNAWKTAWGNCSAIEPLSDIDRVPFKQILYSYPQKIKKLLSVNTAFPLGISTPVARSIRSEYFVFDVSDPNNIDLYIKESLRSKWDQLFIPDVLEGSADWHLLYDNSARNKLDFIVVDKCTTYGIDLRQTNFPNYLQALGANTRLKLFNRRSNLKSLGTVEIKNIWPDKNYFISLINNFHTERWGKPCYEGRNLI
ncbi:MAG: hypothetical protein EOO07_36570, partial [Chitinophagaceae bacterium]